MRDQLEQVYGQRQNFDSIINEQLMEKEQVDAAWEAVHGQHNSSWRSAHKNIFRKLRVWNARLQKILANSVRCALTRVAAARAVTSLGLAVCAATRARSWLSSAPLA